MGLVDLESGRAGGHDRRAVIFDFYGTLIPSTSDQVWAEHAQRMAEPLGVSAVAVLAALDATYDDRICGRTGDVLATTRLVAERAGSTAGEAAVVRAAGLRSSSHRELFAIRPGLAAVLASLVEEDWALGLMSDCTAELPVAWPELAVSPLFRTAVFSCLEGRRKPDPALYWSVMTRLRVRPERCVYVGDGSGNELHGALDLGMQAVLVDTLALDGQRPPLPAGVRWDGPSCSVVDELPSLLSDLVPAVPPAGVVRRA